MRTRRTLVFTILIWALCVPCGCISNFKGLRDIDLGIQFPGLGVQYKSGVNGTYESNEALANRTKADKEVALAERGEGKTSEKENGKTEIEETTKGRRRIIRYSYYEMVDDAVDPEPKIRVIPVPIRPVPKRPIPGRAPVPEKKKSIPKYPQAQSQGINHDIPETIRDLQSQLAELE